MEKSRTSRTGVPGYSRRDMFRMTAAGVAAVAGAPGMVHAVEKAEVAAAVKPAPAKKKIGISVQLYSVRGDCRKDFDKAMERIAGMGFEGLEFAGYYKYGKDPKALRKRLDDLGTRAAATHIGFGSFSSANLQKTIDFHKTIGCKFLIVPGDGRFTGKDRSRQFAEDFNKAAEALKKVGLFCGYHNHTREFGKAEGEKRWWDLFAERTTRDVVLQLDVGWSEAAGVDSAAYIRKYPGRYKTTHFKPHVHRKDKGKIPIIGQDSVPWKEIITACCEVGGTEWFSIEQERYLKGKSPMECTQMSLEGLKKILEEMKKP